jgi:Fur family ferric uptake transcriptional regulator
MEPLCAVFRRTLKGEGLKYTPERARILDAVIQAHEPFTAEQIVDAVRRDPSVKASKATVYRTIKLLATSGIIQQVLLQAELAHYQLAYGQGDSAMLIRTDGPGVESVRVPELAALARKLCEARGLKAEGCRLVVYGAAQSAPK